MDAFPTNRTAGNFIMRLSRLLEGGEVVNPAHLITLRGRGYLFRP